MLLTTCGHSGKPNETIENHCSNYVFEGSHFATQTMSKPPCSQPFCQQRLCSHPWVPLACLWGRISFPLGSLLGASQGILVHLVIPFAFPWFAHVLDMNEAQSCTGEDPSVCNPRQWICWTLDFGPGRWASALGFGPGPWAGLWPGPGAWALGFGAGPWLWAWALGLGGWPGSGAVACAYRKSEVLQKPIGVYPVFGVYRRRSGVY